MQHLIDHARPFSGWAAQHRNLFNGLAAGQSPFALDTCTVLAHCAHADEFLPL